MEFTAEKQRQGQELFQTLVQKSWESETFKNQLISNPEVTIESILGKSMTIPKGKSIIVEDQTDQNVIYLNIPGQVDMDEIELTEQQLELVAGGSTALCYIGGAVAVAQAIDWIKQGWDSVE